MLVLFAFSSEDEKVKFEYLYNTYKKLLLHQSYQILKDYALAEDAVSEAYLRIYKNLHKIDDPESRRSVAFLVTIAKNVSLTLLKQQQAKPVENYDETLADDYSLQEDILSRLSANGIYRIVDELSEELKSVFLLKFAYDMPHKEIAEILGITENNVTVRLHRAKKKLADLLVKEGYSL